MSHIRTQIRDAAAQAVTGLATTGSHVHSGYMYPAGDSGLPGLLVSLEGNEEIVQDSGYGQERTLDVVITGMVKATGDIDAQLNQIAFEVESALAHNATLGGKCAGLSLTSISSGIDTGGEKPVGRIDVRFRVLYFTTAGAPGTNV